MICKPPCNDAAMAGLGENSLQLCVRELYTRPNTPPGRREIIVEPGRSIHAISKMDSAAMYIDGDHMVVPQANGIESRSRSRTIPSC